MSPTERGGQWALPLWLKSEVPASSFVMKPWPLKYDPHEAGPQYVEDLASGYWFSEVLFTAVEMDLFTLLEPGGKSAAEAADVLGCALESFSRFLKALCVMGLLADDGSLFFNSQVARDYLVKGKEGYLGDLVLWRKYLKPNWETLGDCLKAGGRTLYASSEETSALISRTRRYIGAMDAVARIKAAEIWPVFVHALDRGTMLDVGAGSGAVAAAFLRQFPGLSATLMDLPHVLDYAAELMKERCLEERVTYLGANILEDWPQMAARFQLVVLSNVIHAYAEEEILEVLAKAAGYVSEDGFLLIHDSFPEHFPERAHLYDLNMLMNTYNGRIFTSGFVRDALTRLGLHPGSLIPLRTDTGLIIAARSEGILERLRPDRASQLAAHIRTLGFGNVLPIAVDIVHLTEWAPLRCRFGCSSYGKPHCPPNAIPPEKTSEILRDFDRAFLLEGEPPTSLFQHRVLQAERAAFRSGYYKAFAFWAGPCSLCVSCVDGGSCRNPKDARPSMEAAGIDVFETVRRAGLSLRTLSERQSWAKHFALLLLE